jgi:hypothetical protein
VTRYLVDLANISTNNGIFFSHTHSIQIGGVPLLNMSSHEGPDDGLDAAFQTLKAFVTNPAFQRVLAEIRSLPPLERVQEAFARLTVQALAAQGIEVPKDLTITTRASERSASPRTSTADGVTAGEDTEDGPIFEAVTRVCLIPPDILCSFISILPPVGPFGDE